MKSGQFFGTVRFALKRKISVQTIKREHLNHGRVRAFKKNYGKRSKNYGTIDDPRGKTSEYSTVRTLLTNKFGAPTLEVEKNIDNYLFLNF
jgi:hypothetical protein